MYFISYYANITSSIFDKEDMANIIKKSELENDVRLKKFDVKYTRVYMRIIIYIFIYMILIIKELH
jgi:hypothetical protein